MHNLSSLGRKYVGDGVVLISEDDNKVHYRHLV